MNKHIVFSLITILFLTLFLASASASEATPRTLTVPDDYATIQAAVGNATDGDTVYVRSGTYVLGRGNQIAIDTSISLIGENPQTTIIVGGPGWTFGIATIQIGADNVTVSGFTIKDSYAAGINIDSNYPPVGCRIVGNNIWNNSQGIRAYGGSNGVNNIMYPADLTISGNDIHQNWDGGISLAQRSVTISENNIYDNSNSGINLDISENVTIRGNKIHDNGIGVYLRWWGDFYVYGNDITHNNKGGVAFGTYCNNASVYGNNIANNAIGILLEKVGEHFVGVSNTVWHNNIIDNVQQVASNTTTDIVRWDNGVEGNYWSDHRMLYVIDENNTDNHPLAQPVAISASTTLPPSPIPSTSPQSAEYVGKTEFLVIVTALAAVAAALSIVAVALARQIRKIRREMGIASQ
jgi:parallel beta-helix repeat protein